MWAQVWGSSWFWKFCLEVFVLKFCFSTDDSFVQLTSIMTLLQFNQITFLEPAATIKAHDCVQFWCSRLWSFTLNTTLKECCEVYIKCRLKYCLYFGGETCIWWHLGAPKLQVFSKMLYRGYNRTYQDKYIFNKGAQTTNKTTD